jgi:putative restriction endonuclease
MPISFKQIKQGSEWDRPSLAKLWGYKGFQALCRGAFTPANDNKIVLFITEEKQSNATQYDDLLEGNTLKIQGEEGHTADQRILNSKTAGDEIHLFYRKRHHSPFIYSGKATLNKYTVHSDEPSRFVFILDRS